MTDAAPERVRRYVLDASDDDLRRLLSLSDSFATYWGLLHEVMERAGVPRGAIEDLPRSARAAGLDVVEADGFFCTQDPELGFEIHASTLAAARERAVEAGIAAETIDDLVAALRAAQGSGHEWVTSPFLLDLVLRKPIR